MAVTVGQLMTKAVRAIPHDATLLQAAQRMGEWRVGSLLVEQSGKHVGILTETDLVRRGIARGLDAKKEKVSGVMSTPIISIEHDRSPEDACDMMKMNGIRHLAVTRTGKVVGLLSVRDLLVYFKGESEPRFGID